MITKTQIQPPTDNDDFAIKVEHVSKKYCKSLRQSMTYGLQDIGRNMCGQSSHSEKLRKGEFWAVNDVSFELKKGDTLGLIGPNGSGKSTLLKMLNGIFWPDKGKITIKGKVGALIEVGAGFHPLLTGRENVYVNGAILGMTRNEIDAKFDDIIKFAEIGDFIDAPVKSYSSGMFVRLGFSVAVHSEPDILLVDEVLAVGDINFQHKCLRKIADLMAQCAVILVNHNTDIIRFACQRVLFLNKGRSQFIGSATQGVEEYTNFMIRRELPEMIPSGTQYDSVVAVESVKFFDELGNEVTEVYAGKPLILKCTFSASRPIPKAILGVAFYLDARERSFICYSSQVENRQIFNVTNGQHEFIVHISRVDLKAGIYHIAVMVCEKNELATHTWNTNKFLVIKNPRPEFGFYNMVCKFEIK